MTLIPTLFSALFPAASASPASTGRARGSESLLVRGSYNPGARHRPVAATLAIGLPAVLLVAVALSPMVMTPTPEIVDPTVTSIPIEKPLPPPPPELDTLLPPPPTPLTVVKPLILPPFDPVFELPPTPFDPPPLNHNPPADPIPPLTKPVTPATLVDARPDPRYASLFQPDYPAFEQRGGMEGVVKVRVLIGTDGRVKAVEQVSSASPGFFAETRQRALAKWRFKPATRDGVPYESWQVMTVRFEIRNG